MRYLLRPTFFVVLLMLVACVTANPQVSAEKNVDSLYDTDWHLVSMDKANREDAPKYQHFTLRVEKHKLSGLAVNSFSVSAQLLSNGSLQVGRDMVTTRMLPMGRERYLEKIYFSAIASVKTWAKVGDQLILTTSEGSLVFQR